VFIRVKKKLPVLVPQMPCWRLQLACNDALSGTLRTPNGCDGGHHRRMRQTRLVGKNHNETALNVGTSEGDSADGV